MSTLELVEETYINEMNDSLELPRYLYSPVFIRDLQEIKKNGLTPSISNKSWNDDLHNLIFLTSNQNYAGELAKSSNKVDISTKDSVFILKFDTQKINKNNLFLYNNPIKERERVYVYHGNLPYELVELAFSYE